MPITIKGIRIDSVTAARDNDGKTVLSSQYSLISSVDKVLAKQVAGGYGGMEIAPSQETAKALETFLTLYRADIHSVLGLETE